MSEPSLSPTHSPRVVRHTIVKHRLQLLLLLALRDRLTVILLIELGSQLHEPFRINCYALFPTPTTHTSHSSCTRATSCEWCRSRPTPARDPSDWTTDGDACGKHTRSHLHNGAVEKTLVALRVSLRDVCKVPADDALLNLSLIHI